MGLGAMHDVPLCLAGLLFAGGDQDRVSLQTHPENPQPTQPFTDISNTNLRFTECKYRPLFIPWLDINFSLLLDISKLCIDCPKGVDVVARTKWALMFQVR